MKPAFRRGMRSLLRLSVLSSVLILGMVVSWAQQTTPAEPAATPAGAAAHYDRMAAARNVFLKNVGGNDIPFNVISRNFESWGHYILVDSPEKADLVIEIQSPDDGSESKDKDSGQGKTSVYGGGQQKEQPKPAVDMIIFTVYDKNKRPMWIAREEPRSAVRHKAEETHLVEAAQKIFTRFHDRIEPPPKP